MIEKIRKIIALNIYSANPGFGGYDESADKVNKLFIQEHNKFINKLLSEIKENNLTISDFVSVLEDYKIKEID